jgi:uncharacterized protein (DUF58 family)
VITRELLKKVRKIEITTNRVVSSQLAGQYHSVFKGRGMSFSEVRPYQPGDEIRAIDWNVSARMGDTYVKQFEEERELTVMVLVDQSASGLFGTRAQSKGELAAEIAAVLAFSAIENNDRVGLILFTDRIELFVPPKKGRKHVLRVITEILDHKPASTRTDLSAGLSFLSRVAKRRTVAFLISDFLARDYERALRVVHQRHDLVPIVLCDPAEEEIPPIGVVMARDAETGEVLPVDTSDARFRERWRRHAVSERDARERLLRKLTIDWVDVRTDAPYLRPLIRFFERRARRQ